jgi:hypothetical protein
MGRRIVDKKNLSEEFGGELAGKAVIWGPAVAGGVVAGPAGAFVGAVIGITAFLLGSNGFSPPPDSDPPKK